MEQAGQAMTAPKPCPRSFTLLGLKRLVKKLERGSSGVPLSSVDIEFWLEGSGESQELSLESVGQFHIKPDASFHFKIIKRSK